MSKNQQNNQETLKELEVNIPVKPRYHQALTDAQILLNYLKLEEGQEMLSSFLLNQKESYLKEFDCLYCEDEPTTEDIIEDFTHKVFRCITSLNGLPTPIDGTDGTKVPVPCEKFTLQALQYEHKHLSVHPLLIPLFNMSSNNNTENKEKQTDKYLTENILCQEEPDDDNEENSIFVPRRIVDNLDCDELVYFNYNPSTQILTLRYKLDIIPKPSHFRGFLPSDANDTITLSSVAGELESNIIGYEPSVNMTLLFIFEHILILLGTMWNQEEEVKSLFIQTNLTSGEKEFIKPSFSISKQSNSSPVMHLSIAPTKNQVGILLVAPLIDKTSVHHVQLEIPLKQELHSELNFLSEVIHTKEVQEYWKHNVLNVPNILEINMYGLFDILNRAVVTNYSIKEHLFNTLRFNSFINCFDFSEEKSDEEIDQLLSEPYKDYLEAFAVDFDDTKNLAYKTLHYSPCWISREVTALNTCEIINGVYHLDAEFTGVPVERLRKWLGGIVDLNGDPKGISKIHIQRVN